MTIEQKKQLLIRYKEITRHIDELRAEKRKWYNDNWYHGTGLGSGPRNASADGKGVELTAERAAEFNREIDAEIKRLYDLRIRIERAVESLNNPNEQRVLRLFYLGEIDECGNRNILFSIEQIAEKMGYTPRHTYRLFKRALADLPEI